MTDETTPNQETVQTPGSTEETKEETFSKSQFTELTQKEIAKVTAKWSKKLEALQSELDAERKKSLPDPEKIKLELAERDSKIKEYEGKLAEIDSRDRKRQAIEDAKLTLPDDITLKDLLEMMPGNEDDQIAGYIEKFKKMFPASKGLGTATTTGAPNAPKLTLKEQANAIEKQLQDPKLDWMTQRKLNDELGTINAKLLLGVTS